MKIVLNIVDDRVWFDGQEARPLHNGLLCPAERKNVLGNDPGESVLAEKIVRKKSPWVDVSFLFECLRGGKDLVGRREETVHEARKT